MADKVKSNKRKRSLIPLITVIAIIAIAVANFIVWKGYFAEKSQIEVLESEVVAVNEQIAQTEPPPTGLEAKLQKAEDDLATVVQIFPENVDRTDIVDFVLTTAETCDVQFIPLVSEGVGISKNSQSYVLLQYSGTVTGKLNNATNFITKLRNGDYPTIVITECTVERVSGFVDDISDSELEVTIDLSFSIYAASVLESKDSAL